MTAGPHDEGYYGEETSGGVDLGQQSLLGGQLGSGEEKAGAGVGGAAGAGQGQTVWCGCLSLVFYQQVNRCRKEMEREGERERARAGGWGELIIMNGRSCTTIDPPTIAAMSGRSTSGCRRPCRHFLHRREVFDESHEGLTASHVTEDRS